MIRGRISIGEFVTFQLFLGRLVWPMIAIGWVVNLTQRGTASLARIRKILDTEPAIRDEEPLADPGEILGDVRFRDLTFAYREGTPVLSDDRPRRAGGADGGGRGAHRARARARCWR